MKRWVWLGFVLLLLLAGCGRRSRDLPDVDVVLEIKPSPPQLGLSSIVVTLHDADGQPISGARVELEGNMNHAGMVPVFADASEVAPGRYQAELEIGSSSCMPTCPTVAPWNARWTCRAWTRSAAIRPRPEPRSESWRIPRSTCLVRRGPLQDRSI
jgi:hypothetical protein